MAQPQFPGYNNKQGEKFQIGFEDASVSDKADFWGFFFPVVDSVGRKRMVSLCREEKLNG
jgi:hypothetical protein